MMLAQQRLAHHHVVPFHHVGAHREAIDRRGLDGRQLAQARHRHLQRARDRRGGEREHVDVGAQLLELLLVGDAEALLLVDDDEAEVLELDGLGQDRMGADDDVDRRRRRARRASPWSPWRGTRRDRRPTLSGKPAKRSAKFVIVLAREQRGRRDDRDLLPAPSPRRTRRAARPRSCRSRRRRTPAGPSACPRARSSSTSSIARSWSSVSSHGKRSTNWVIAAVVGLEHAALRSARAAAVRSSSSAISRMRSLSRRLRLCHASPPSRSSATPSLVAAVAARARRCSRPGCRACRRRRSSSITQSCGLLPTGIGSSPTYLPMP